MTSISYFQLCRFQSVKIGFKNWKYSEERRLSIAFWIRLKLLNVKLAFSFILTWMWVTLTWMHPIKAFISSNCISASTDKVTTTHSDTDRLMHHFEPWDLNKCCNDDALQEWGWEWGWYGTILRYCIWNLPLAQLLDSFTDQQTWEIV